MAAQPQVAAVAAVRRGVMTKCPVRVSGPALALAERGRMAFERFGARRARVGPVRAGPALAIVGGVWLGPGDPHTLANGVAQNAAPAISGGTRDPVGAVAQVQQYAAIAPIPVTIGVVVLLLVGMVAFAAGTRRSVVASLQRLAGMARTPTGPDAESAPQAGTRRGAHRAQLRTGALEITSSDELKVLAAAFNTLTQQMRTRAQEQRQVRALITAERDLMDSVLEVAGSLLLVAVLDQDGRIIQFNRTCESTTGYRSAEVEGRRVSELFLPPEEIEYAAPAFGEDAAAIGELDLPRRFVCTWIGRDGARHQIAWSNAAAIDRHSGRTHIIATGLDITDRRMVEAELREARERFRQAFDNAPIGMCLVSIDGRFVQVNRALAQMLGRSETELLKLGVRDVAHPGDVKATLQTIANVRNGQAYAAHDEIRYLRADGRVVWARVSVSVVHRDNGEPLYYLTQIQDITAHRAAEERLAQQALRDPLTGLPNRTLFMEQVRRELNSARRSDGLTGLLYTDLDGFKIINDTLGHDSGDSVLREVARRLRSDIGSSDTVARFGSDEFVILCPRVPNQAYLVDMARRLADSVSQPIIVDGRRELVVSAGIGIAVSESADLDADRLVRNANVALYQAKAGGRNGCRLFEESLNQYVMDRARIEEGLREGLREGHFVLHFEPIVDLTTHQVVSVEALVRLNDPELGLLMPGTFIEIAEDSGLIAPIGTWVLEEACRQLAAWRQLAGHGYERLNVAVNVSARQVARGDLADTVARVLAESNLPPQSLTLELTESALMEADVGALGMLERIHEMGVRLGIDDFGTGYSSLLYLKRLPVSFIKIDQSFVSGLAPNRTDREIVTAVVRLGRALGLATIAEGVESAEQLAALRDLGCDLAQGYLFGPAATGPPDLSQPSMSVHAPPGRVPASELGSQHSVPELEPKVAR